MTPNSTTRPQTHSDKEVADLELDFLSVFRDDSPDGFPPTQEVDHKIEVDAESTPPYKVIFQLSPAELLTTKVYVTSLLKKGKIRPSKSSYGEPLIFVEQKCQLRGLRN